MYIKQVRTRGNSFSAVQYDKDGNIILQTKAARKARAEARKASAAKQAIEKNKKKSNKKQWKELSNKFENTCSVCNKTVAIGEKILWNVKTKKIKHMIE